MKIQKEIDRLKHEFQTTMNEKERERILAKLKALKRLKEQHENRGS